MLVDDIAHLLLIRATAHLLAGRDSESAPAMLLRGRITGMAGAPDGGLAPAAFLHFPSPALGRQMNSYSRRKLPSTLKHVAHINLPRVEVSREHAAPTALHVHV